MSVMEHTPAWRTVPILAYHRISDPKGDHVPTVTADTFERQLRMLRRLGYRAMDLAELGQQIGTGASIDRRTFSITFDDGYEETLTIALPLLQRFGFSATVFVTPGEVGDSGFMTWAQIREASRSGIMAVGSHTVHHAYLPLLPLQRVEQELRVSKEILDQELGQPVSWLSYPVGGFTSRIQEIARGAGYAGACTTNRSARRTRYDLFALRRIKVTERDRTPFSLWAKLSGYYDLFRRLEPPA